MRPIILIFLLSVGLTACDRPAQFVPPPSPSEGEIAALTHALVDMSPSIDPREARRAAEIAYLYPLQLARLYHVTDPPLVHNSKVNRGKRERGLCYEWADDLQARLAAESFKTIALHRAIANSNNPLRIDHSTVIIGAHGESIEDGIIADPWRFGGKLFWSLTPEDTRYKWVPRAQVFQDRAARRARQANAF